MLVDACRCLDGIPLFEKHRAAASRSLTGHRAMRSETDKKFNRLTNRERALNKLDFAGVLSLSLCLIASKQTSLVCKHEQEQYTGEKKSYEEFVALGPICLSSSSSSSSIHWLIRRRNRFHSEKARRMMYRQSQRNERTDEWPDTAFFLRFFLDFLLFLDFVLAAGSVEGAAGAGAPPSLSRVSPSSLSGATT